MDSTGTATRRTLLRGLGAALLATPLLPVAEAAAAPPTARRAAARRASAKRAAAQRAASRAAAAKKAAARKAAAARAAAARKAAADRAAAAARKAAADRAAAAARAAAEKAAAAAKAAAERAAAEQAAADRARAEADAAEQAATPQPGAPAPSGALRAAGGFLTDDPLLHLLRRTTYGLTPALVGEARTMGAQAWLDRQLDPGTIDDAACEAHLAPFRTLGMTAPQVRTAASGNGNWFSMDEVVRAQLVRACWSQRQLFEVVVDVWQNHLNVTCPSSDVWDNRAEYDRDVIRRHALGRYSDMLVASATSPAMLRYLDGASSRGSKPNENYGREVLELHTVGIDAGYTEAEMHDSALVLTGLTVWNDWDRGVQPGQAGTFRFRSDWHHVGPVSVLGWSHPNSTAAGGLQVAESYLRHLASHPATARRIAAKLCVRFVSDAPPPALVERLAQVYLAADTAIVPVLRALFASPEFAASTGQKTRRPFEDLAATVRALGITPKAADPKTVDDLLYRLGGLGHAPLGWHPPNGYPDVAAAWSSAGGTLERWNIHLGLASDWWKARLTLPALSGLVVGARDAGDLLDRLSASLLHQPLRPADRAALLAFLGVRPTDPPGTKGADTRLLPVLTALLLDAPAWSLR